jgi:RNA polymerase sigma-70 factor (ECF subfamily)
MMLVDGEVGAVIAPRGRLLMVFRFTVHDGKVVAIDAIADPEHLRRVDLAVLTD